MYKHKIIFLDIDGVLNNHRVISMYNEDSTNVEMINNLNSILKKTNAKIVIISNWAQIMSKERLIQFLTQRGVLEGSIIDIIIPKEIEENGVVQYVIEKGAFIYEYININNITNYVIIDDDLQSSLIDTSKLIVPLKNSEYPVLSLGITEKEVKKIISLLNG